MTVKDLLRKPHWVVYYALEEKPMFRTGSGYSRSINDAECYTAEQARLGTLLNLQIAKIL